MSLEVKVIVGHGKLARFVGGYAASSWQRLNENLSFDFHLDCTLFLSLVIIAYIFLRVSLISLICTLFTIFFPLFCLAPTVSHHCFSHYSRPFVLVAAKFNFGRWSSKVWRRTWVWILTLTFKLCDVWGKYLILKSQSLNCEVEMRIVCMCKEIPLPRLES